MFKVRYYYNPIVKKDDVYSSGIYITNGKKNRLIKNVYADTYSDVMNNIQKSMEDLNKNINSSIFSKLILYLSV